MSIIDLSRRRNATEARVEMETERDETAPMTVQLRLRPWRVCACCGHAWKSRATRGRPRCRACERRLRADAERMGAAVAGGPRR